MKILVSGQGFAGSLLAWFLIKNGCEVTVIDNNDRSSSTRVSAGIMLPVTGRRLAKTQNADVILPFAHRLYQDIEKETGEPCFSPKKVLQLFSSIANRNEWYARSADVGMEDYVGEILDKSVIDPSIKNEFGGVLLKQSGSVNPLLLLEIMKKFIQQNGTYFADNLNWDELKFSNSSIQWNTNAYDYVILCEGYLANSEGPFKYLPFKPAKGEILDFRAPLLSSDYIIVSGNYILPMMNNMFRIGATYEWENLDTKITETAAMELEKNLTELINCDYQITLQQAGVRPSIRDRRPLLGFHPEYKRLGVFNGLGTKGAMQGPYYANQMSELILSGK